MLDIKLPEPLALLHAAEQALAAGALAVLVCVAATRGSAPRFTGAAMLVTQTAVTGTVGGGHLEHVAITLARSGAALPQAVEYPLGAVLGQCCGGAMTLRYEALCAGHLSALRAACDTAKTLFLFGAGHVARALVPILAPLPLRIVWGDARDAVNTHQAPFPQALPPHISTVISDTLEAELCAARSGDLALMMTHSHALDERLVHAALRNPLLAYIGVIGSATKRRLFEQRLAQRGFSAADFERMTCPIGLVSANTSAPSAAHERSPHSKLPAVIAALVAAQLAQFL
jgi:xanthine dehydrogenase accessory factor